MPEPLIYCECGNQIDPAYVGASRSWTTGEMLCEHCGTSEDMVHCSNCSFVCTAETIRTGPDGECLCSGCWDSLQSQGLIHTCAECSIHVAPPNIIIARSRYYCPDCAPGNSQPVHNYTYNPNWQFRDTAGDNSTELYLGMEIEVDTTNHTREERTIRNELPDWLYIKSDSSLLEGGRSGFEIVTHPLSIRWIGEHLSEWDNILQTLYDSGVRAKETPTCGFHIHMSKAAFTSFTLYKFLKLVYGNPNLIMLVSQRDRESLQRWASLSISQSSLITRVKQCGQNRNDRHCAVNLGRDTTVELRVFKGSINPLTFRKNIEFATAAYIYARDHTPNELSGTEFSRWVLNHDKEFRTLARFLNSPESERESLFGYDAPQAYPIDWTRGVKIACA